MSEIRIETRLMDKWIIDDDDPILIPHQIIRYSDNQWVGEIIGTITAIDNLSVTNYQFRHANGELSNISEDGYYMVGKNGEVSLTSNDDSATMHSLHSSTYDIVVSDAVGNISRGFSEVQIKPIAKELFIEERLAKLEASNTSEEVSEVQIKPMAKESFIEERLVELEAGNTPWVPKLSQYIADSYNVSDNGYYGYEEYDNVYYFNTDPRWIEPERHIRFEKPSSTHDENHPKIDVVSTGDNNKYVPSDNQAPKSDDNFPTQISIEGRPLNNIPLGIETGGHLYLVHTDEHGNEHTIRGGASSSIFAIFQEPKIEVSNDIPLAESQDTREVEGYRTPESRGSHILDLDGRDPEVVWQDMIEYAQRIKGSDINYHTLGPNSNSVVVAILEHVNIDFNKNHPNDVNGIDEDSYFGAYPGSNKSQKIHDEVSDYLESKGSGHDIPSYDEVVTSESNSVTPLTIEEGEAIITIKELTDILKSTEDIIPLVEPPSYKDLFGPSSDPLKEVLDHGSQSTHDASFLKYLTDELISFGHKPPRDRSMPESIESQYGINPNVDYTHGNWISPEPTHYKEWPSPSDIFPFH